MTKKMIGVEALSLYCSDQSFVLLKHKICTLLPPQLFYCIFFKGNVIVVRMNYKKKGNIGVDFTETLYELTSISILF